MAERDPEGFLRQLDSWEPVVAEVIAADLGIQLTDAHWEVIEVVRRFYQEYGLSPTNRVTQKILKSQLDPSFDSIRLMRLFGGRARRHLAQIAGLPKPSDCD